MVVDDGMRGAAVVDGADGSVVVVLDGSSEVWPSEGSATVKSTIAAATTSAIRCRPLTAIRRGFDTYGEVPCPDVKIR